MNYLLKRIACFSILALLLYPIFLVAFRIIMPISPNLHYNIMSHGHIYTRLQEVKERKNVDILFLGSSRAYRGFDVRNFDNSFNLGSSSQTPLQTYLLLNRYLDSLNPKTIVYAVDPSMFASDGVESSLDVIANDKNDIGSLKMALKINNLKTYNALIFGYIHDILNPNFSLPEPANRGIDTYISGGYVQREMECFQYGVSHPTINKWQPNKEQLVAFENIVGMAKDKKIELVFVYPPIASALYQSYVYMDSFDAKMKTFGEYYNFNEIINLNDSLHFYDSDHLNQDGVDIFNAGLLEYVVKSNN